MKEIQTLLHHGADVGTGADDDVTVFANKIKTDSIPGLPKLDSGRVVRVCLILSGHILNNSF